MKILFVVSDLFFGEPIGVMTLSAFCKENNHHTHLLAIRKHRIMDKLTEFQPNIIAYSTMSSEVDLFVKTDEIIKKWAQKAKRKITRIMGGPHPTYFPEILNQMQLDAICLGEGENALLHIINKIENNKKIENIPNVLTPGEEIESMEKELIPDLDKTPFLDRDIYYEAMPLFKKMSMRSFMTSRGCPYHCTYCHNHAFNKMFEKCGKILRRKSVGYVISEIKHTIEKYPPVNLVKFCDDIFALKIDNWILEFLKRYKKEINLPFYCLMRSNTLSEEMAELLAVHGCISLGMSVESGNEDIRSNILKRNLSDEVIINSFKFANKYKLKTWGNTLLAIPGGTIKDDINSFIFTKKLRMTSPTFGIFNPYPRTELTEYAKKINVLDKDYNFHTQFGHESPLTNYTAKEKKIQLNIVYLGPIFTKLPDFFRPLFKLLIKMKPNIVFKFIGTTQIVIMTGKNVFPDIYPKSIIKLLQIFYEGVLFWVQKKTTVQ